MRSKLAAVRRIPAVPVVLAVYVLLALCVPLLGDGAGVAIVIGLVVYCALRPTKRVEVFLNACAPGAAGTLVHDVFGISSLWGLALVPFVLMNLREIDRRARSTN